MAQNSSETEASISVSGSQESPSKAEEKAQEKVQEGGESGKASGRARRKWSRILTVLFLLVLVALLAVGGYWGWREWQAVVAEHSRERVQLLAQIERQQQAIEHIQAEQQREWQRSEAEAKQQQDLIESMQRRLDTHNKRLLSLSTTSRDDWKLAEAEYLLQLANQRLLVERNTINAEALLEAADTILRDLDDVDLYPIRQGIARDLTALKLVAKVDREGIYMRLSALSDQLLTLQYRPVKRLSTEDQLSLEHSVTPEVEPESWVERWKAGLRRGLNHLASFIRVRRHDESLEPILPPSSASYLQQNLRFMLERAQLALLREQPVVYTQSLQQAREWLTRYYALADNVKALDQALAELQSIDITQSLPDISGSLEQIKLYSERLHKLAVPQPSQGGPATDTGSSGASPVSEPEQEAVGEVVGEVVGEGVDGGVERREQPLEPGGGEAL